MAITEFVLTELTLYERRLPDVPHDGCAVVEDLQSLVDGHVLRLVRVSKPGHVEVHVALSDAQHRHIVTG